MVRLLVGCGIFAVVAIGLFLFWWSQNPIVFSTSSLDGTIKARQVQASPGSINIEIELQGSAEGYFISEISLPRQVALAAGIDPPAGFLLEPMPLDEADKRDPESVEFVEKWNAENVRFAGKLPLIAGKPTVISMPVDSPDHASGEIALTCEWRGRLLGGSMSFAKVALSPNLPEAATEVEP